MNVRSKLSLQFSFIVAAILLFLSLSVYFSASQHRKSEFYERLKNRGIADARLFIDVNEVDSTLLRIIDQNIRTA
ncbi:MAG TPA: two-component sensor histidine kinase, partial [Bacteroidia bacterium]|nr:two-component sensor histidine kinase [Bacteroidia bacterium]